MISFSFSNQASEYPVTAIVAIPTAIISIIAAVLTAKKLNKHMIAKTQTNKIVLEDIRAGVYKSELPEDKEQMVIRLLEKGMVTSVKEGLRYMKYRNAGRVAGILLGLVTLGGCYLISKEMDKATNSFIQGIRNEQKGYWEKKAINDAARKAGIRKANALQKEADFLRRQAEKAINYNANSYDAYRRANIADNAQYKANKARKTIGR